MKSEYRYTNDMGYRKLLTISFAAKDGDKYLCNLWCEDNGEFCGSGYLTEQEIKEMLSHYGVPIE